MKDVVGRPSLGFLLGPPGIGGRTLGSLQEFGSRIRELRDAKGISVEDFAEILGYELPSLVNIENGFRRPGREKTADMCWRLDMSPEEGMYWFNRLGYPWFMKRR